MFIPLTPLRFLHRAIDLYGEKIGVISGDAEFTYGEFGERCERLASALATHGIQQGDRVAYLSFNTHQLAEGYFGVPQARGVLTPLNVRLSPGELVYQLNHSGAKMLIFEQDFAPLIWRFRIECPAIQRYVSIGNATGADLEYEELIAAGRAERADIFSFEENTIAELFYTGGSTGTPKGVMLSHRALYLHAMSAAMLKREPEIAVNLASIPLFHANGWGFVHIATMLGIKQVLMRGFDAAMTFGLIQKHGVTHLGLVPVMANMLLHFAKADTYERGSVLDIAVGGAPCTPQLFERLERLFPNARVVTGYGMTETAPFLCFPPPKKTHEEQDEPRRRRQSSVGWPAMGAQVKVMDGKGREVPRDGKTVGEICAMGDNVMDGYLDDPAATAAAFSGQWLRTGDLAVWHADGTIGFVDRIKDVIVSGGENISSLEIETAILNHPAVLECAVVSAPDAQWGESPVAIVVPKAGAELNGEELISFLSERLTRFKLPRTIEFRAEALPRSVTLKVKKMLLREKYWQGERARVH
jgi:fatty-acyl-CoA synthase